jgi:PhnB protein
MTYPPLTAYLTVDGAAGAIAFYQAAFDATERYRLTDPRTGKIGHAELEIEGGLLMLADENPQFNRSPRTLGGVSGKLSLMVADVDATFRRAVDAGAEPIMEPADMFYGFRNACVRDPAGHEWMIQHKIREVSPEDMQAAWEKMLADCPAD